MKEIIFRTDIKDIGTAELIVSFKKDMYSKFIDDKEAQETGKLCFLDFLTNMGFDRNMVSIKNIELEFK